MSDYNATRYHEQGGNAVRDENVVGTTAAVSTGRKNYGLLVVKSSQFQQLDPPINGAMLDVLFLATTGTAAQIKTGSTAIFFNSSAGKDFVMKVTAVKAAVSNHGIMMKFHGASTTQWWVGAGGNSTTNHLIAFSATS